MAKAVPVPEPSEKALLSLSDSLPPGNELRENLIGKRLTDIKANAGEFILVFGDIEWVVKIATPWRLKHRSRRDEMGPLRD